MAGEAVGPAPPRPLSPARADRPAEDRLDRREALDPLDPETRRAAQLGPPAVLGETPAGSAGRGPLSPPADTPASPRTIEELLPQLVRRIAWAGSGDRRKGTVQLELGAGAHAGTVITVHASDRRVRVDLDGHGDLDELRERIDARLAQRGLEVEK